MDLEIPLIVLTGLGLLAAGNSNKNKKSTTPLPLGEVVGGKYIPNKQPEFKSKLNSILKALESKLKIYGLRDYFITIGWIESRYYPSAIQYRPNQGYHPHLFPENKWIKQRSLWEYTGGLFQMFPYVALDTWDGKAQNLAPTTVFNPYYQIAYALDFAYRLQKKYNAETWFDIRLGWAGLNILLKKPGQKLIEIENRLLKSTNVNNINPDFLYDSISLKPYEKYQFSGILKLVKTL
jgi:hypothetical protein